jgi:hypothetical protein
MQNDSPGGESWVSLSVWSPQVVQEPMANFLVEQTARGVELLPGPPATVPGTADAESTSGKPAK